MSGRLMSWIVGGVVACGFLAVGSVSAADEPRFFEQRIYTAHEGKLDDLNKRFREHTCALFEKHGMELIGFWVPTEGEKSENTLIYILAYPSKEARDASWQGFV
ncbi:MAG: NIPSNAP family protein, partial [Pirellulaceae bacterium]